ncbi:MAG: DUF523 domain-containing protein [Deltaproteobacteria bacterium]|nr:DUF523 domain-containing protein [Deltaproteobacteria bacterium]
MIIVSACLLGIKCRYDGESRSDETVLSMIPWEILIPVCPEQLGGLSTPRPPAEIVGGNGLDVLNGSARVIDREGCDVTASFIRGGREALKIARLLNITTAIMKENSPSCGTFHIMRKGSRSKGPGVASALFAQNGIEVVSSERINEYLTEYHCDRK